MRLRTMRTTAWRWILMAWMAVLLGRAAEALEYPALLQAASEEADSRGTVTLFEVPGPKAKAAAKIGAWDDAVALGERTVDGVTWYEVDHPTRAGTAWARGTDMRPYEDAGSPLMRTIAQIRLAFGNAPEKAKLDLGEPASEETAEAVGKGVSITQMEYAGPLDLKLEYVWGLMYAETEGEAPFGELRVGDPVEELRDLLGEPLDEEGDEWTYRPEEHVGALRFTIRDGRLARMTYFITYNL